MAATKSPRIKVPPEAVRARERILEGATITRGHVWVTCHNCGGSGNYPSSMIPAGRCRFYCWQDRTPETFGKLPVAVDEYVKREQKRDRAEYRAKVRAELANAARADRLDNLDARIAALAEAFNLDPANLPDVYEGKRSANLITAASLIGTWLAKGDLTEKQWELAARLPKSEAERRARAAEREAVHAKSGHVGTVGERLDVTATIERVSEFDAYTPSAYRRSYPDRCVRYAIKARDDNGNAFSWFSDHRNGLAEGQTVTLRGTVKRHETYKGERQTVLQRVKVLRPEEAR